MGGGSYYTMTLVVGITFLGYDAYHKFATAILKQNSLED